MKQYVGLLEVICSSSPLPTAELLQDVSVLYAKLGEHIYISSLFFHLVAQIRRSVCPDLVIRGSLTCYILLPISDSGAVRCNAMLCYSLFSTAQKCKTIFSEQENIPQSKLDPSYCSTLKGNEPAFFFDLCLFLLASLFTAMY